MSSANERVHILLPWVGASDFFLLPVYKDLQEDAEWAARGAVRVLSLVLGGTLSLPPSAVVSAGGVLWVEGVAFHHGQPACSS